MRKMQGKAAIAIGALYVGFVGWSLYGAIFPVETYAFRMVHMAFIFGLAFWFTRSGRTRAAGHGGWT